MSNPVSISMGTTDEAPLVINAGNDEIILPYDDGVKLIGEVAQALDVSVLSIVHQLVQGEAVIVTK
jgi:hypothetical protein